MKCNPLRWLWGLLLIPVITYFAVQYRHKNIESDLGARTMQALKNAGLPWAGSAFQGRDGLLSGKAIEEPDRDDARRVVNNIWGVRRIEDRTNLIASENNYLWNAKRRNGELRLSGFVPNEATRRSIRGVAKANFPGIKIVDKMKLARGVPRRDTWMGGISYALKQLTMLKDGRATLDNLGLSVKGQARDFAAYETVKSSLANGLPKGITLKRDEVRAPKVSPYTWQAKLSGSKLELTGHVPSKTAREHIFASVNKRFPKVSIVDRMNIARGEPKDWSDTVDVSLRELARLQSGRVSLTNYALAFRGTAKTERLAGDVGKLLDGGLPKKYSLSRKLSFIEPDIKPVSPFTTSAWLKGDAVELEGYVPGEKERAALVGEARTRFKNRRIIDRLKIAAGAPKGWQNCVVVGLGALNRLGNGRLDVVDQKLMVSGSTQDEVLANSLAGEVRAAVPRSCKSDVRIAYKAPPEPNLVWSAVHENKRVVLSGEVPDAGTKTQLVRNARDLFKGAQIIDRMTVVGGRSVKWRSVALDGLKMVARLRKGKALIDAQELTVIGEARDTSTEKAITAQLSRDLPGGYHGRDITWVRSDAMIWAEQESKRKAAAEAKRKAKEAEAVKLAALEGSRMKAEAERLAALEASRMKAEADRLAAQEAARQKAEMKRLASLEAARLKAEQDIRLQQAAAAAAAAKQMARLEARRIGCETNIRSLASTGVIRFRTAKAKLASASFATLQQLADATNACPGLNLEIAGHTDSDGSAGNNQSLSERRAQAVVDYLSGLGVDANRLNAVGYGESQPIVANDSRANKALNRRIEFNVTAN